MKQPLVFNKASQPPSAVILAAETQALRDYLKNAKPAALITAETIYTDLREQRAEAREQYQTAAAIHRSTADNTAPASTLMNQLEATIHGLNAEIDAVREKVITARNTWLPRYRAQLKSQLQAADGALAEAAILVEAAAQMHSEADKFATQNGLNDTAITKSKRLADIALALKRFCGKREKS